MQVTLQGCSLGVSGSVTLFPHSLTDEQVNDLFILANHTMTLALLMEALPELTRLLYFPVSTHSEENILVLPCPYKKSGFPPVSLNADAQTVLGACKGKEFSAFCCSNHVQMANDPVQKRIKVK